MLTRKSSTLLITAVAFLSLWVATIIFMQRTRSFEGIWIDLFEGSSFFEDQTMSEACSSRFDDAPWLAYYPDKRSEIGKLLSKSRESGILVSEYGRYPVAAYKVKFTGRKKISNFLGFAPFLGIGYGHMGVSGSEVEVARMDAIELIANAKCDVR